MVVFTEEVKGYSNADATISALKNGALGAADRLIHRGLPDETWPIVEAAKFYAEQLGWAVMPVNPRTKAPLILDWPNQASKDPTQIDAWWKKHPNAMVGVLCGPRSGVCVIDADAKPDKNGTDGLSHLETLETAHGDMGEVPEAKTAGGGAHLFFDAASLPFDTSVERVAPNAPNVPGFVIAWVQIIVSRLLCEVVDRRPT